MKGRDYKTKEERDDFRILVEEGGVHKTYQFPMRMENGEPHYLLARLAEIPDGTEVIMEMKHEGATTFISVAPADEAEETGEEEMPTIQMEEGKEDSGTKDVDPDDLPF